MKICSYCGSTDAVSCCEYRDMVDIHEIWVLYRSCYTRSEVDRVVDACKTATSIANCVMDHAEDLYNVVHKAGDVRNMFDAQMPNELLVAHDHLADALDELEAKRVKGKQ